MEKFVFTGILLATLLSMVDHRTPLVQTAPHVPTVQKNPSIGQQIQLSRIRKGFSQKYLARMSGVDLAEISAIERNVNIPTINTLYKIQEIIGGGIVINGDAMARL